MSEMASQITSVLIVCPTVCSCPDQRKHQSSASLAFVRGVHRWPVTRKMFPFDDVIMQNLPTNLSICLVWKPNSFCISFQKLMLQYYTQLPTATNIPSKLAVKCHDDVFKWKHFPRNWPFVRGIHRSRWIPHTKASDVELWCFIWSASE